MTRFDFFTAYTRIHRAVYGRDPCTREQWNAWVAQPESGRRESDVQFDHDKETRGDAQ